MSYDEIKHLELKLGEANADAERDTSALIEELFDDKVVILARNGDPIIKPQIIEMHKLPKRYTSIKIDKLDITVFTDSAIVHSLNTMYPAGQEPFQILYLRIWAKKNDKWRIVGGSTTAVNKS